MNLYQRIDRRFPLRITAEDKSFLGMCALVYGPSWVLCSIALVFESTGLSILQVVLGVGFWLAVAAGISLFGYCMSRITK